MPEEVSPYPAVARLFIRGRLIDSRLIPAEAERHRVYGSLLNFLKEEMKRDPEAPHMIEIECLNLPLNERFLRFGTDPSMMKEPEELKCRESC